MELPSNIRYECPPFDDLAADLLGQILGFSSPAAYNVWSSMKSFKSQYLTVYSKEKSALPCIAAQYRSTSSADLVKGLYQRYMLMAAITIIAVAIIISSLWPEIVKERQFFGHSLHARRCNARKHTLGNT